MGLFTGEEIEPVLSGLKSAVLGVSAQKIELDADPEEGEVRELAALYDQFRLAEKKADLAHKYAVRTESEARDMMERLKLSGEADKADIRETVRQALETRQKAEAARQRAERERLKRDRIQDEARARGVSTKS